MSMEIIPTPLLTLPFENFRLSISVKWMLYNMLSQTRAH